MLFQNWFDRFNQNAESEAVTRLIGEGKSLWLSGVWGAARAFVAGAVLSQLRRPALIVCNQEEEALSLSEELRFFLQGFPSLSDPKRQSEFHIKYPTILDPEKDPLVYFPAYEYDAHEAVNKEQGRNIERLLILKRLAAGEPCLIVTTLKACAQKLLDPTALQAALFSLEKSKSYSLDELSIRLVGLGYSREYAVEQPGQFSVRGGIMDLATPNQDWPVRLEFEGNRLESLRFFDPSTQRSQEEVESVEVLPFHELLMDEEVKRAGLRRILDSSLKPVIKQQWYDRLSAQTQFCGMEWLLPFFYQNTLFDYLGQMTSKPVLLVDQAQQMRDRLEAEIADAEKIKTSRAAQNLIFPTSEQLFVDWREFTKALSQHPCLFTSLLPHTLAEFKSIPQKAFVFKSHDISRGDFNLFASELLVWMSKKYQSVVVSRNHGDLLRLKDMLAEKHYGSVELREQLGPEKVPEGSVGLSLAKVEKGFVCPSLGLVLISDQEVFQRNNAIQAPRVYRHRYRGLKGARPIESFAELKEGQYAVHVDHGIGIFRGVVRMKVDEHAKDFVCLEYADAERLYVPIDQVNLVQKYLGGDEAPRLYKLGGNSWANVREKVKQSVAELAQELLTMYAKRHVAEVPGMGADTQWQQAFEESFPFEETPDQLKAIEEVKRDMEKTKPMDRLICGDVGFGKTEVALRAAFKAVMAGYQVAVLVPTTILAQQHYNTFSARMADFPVRIAMLSRFKSPKEQKAIVKALQEGKLDLVIGTHRLLQKDMQFKKLGLVIIDEEQRFGVAHKEKLKKLRAQVEVLAMSATPIPRTLHFSLSGLRDMSVIETPPLDRLPVRTYVLEENQTLIREAILQELKRGGQVFFVHNRVKDIEKVAERLRALVPEAHIAVGHGQMEKHELEKVMVEFLGKVHDVLVATTIIESGLDIPSVNTILINHAEDFGLSQLYQLRGRVGRSEKQAYAYLFYPKDRSIPEIAEKRLSAIEEFTDLGAGFKVAMRDLEIRGTGNILGPEQHGHVAAVGFDLYCHLLNEAVAQLKGEDVKEEKNPTLQLELDAYIPEDFIPDPRQKMDLYKRLAGVENEKDMQEIQAEIRDRFGEPPTQVLSLYEVVSIRQWAKKLGLSEVSQKGGQVVLRFYPNETPAEGFVEKVLKQYGSQVRFLAGPPPGLLFYTAQGNGLQFLKTLLPALAPYVMISAKELVQAG